MGVREKMNGVEEGELKCAAIHGLLTLTKRVEDILKTSQLPMFNVSPL